MMIAFATQNLTHIDAHFGWAQHFLIYEVSAEGHTYLRTVRFKGALRADGDEGKLPPKLKALRGCALVFASDVGESAHARLSHQGVHPIVRCAGWSIAHALEDLIQTLRVRPSPWVRHAEQRRRLRRSPRRTPRLGFDGGEPTGPIRTRPAHS
ncbi:nitrogen fixation protein NifX [Roseospira marina]|uniref:Nitrogen fixation protein NifX n=1 Tax=Roseospira marina TaxID=140057 RepID=A0A5M6I8X2_9PROT|nr:NifB/NifX family molybdenum-iron cluster-binding protein [Roseospira marina]KAA5604255.1 nitrogen fixation protein NifX [Roseospira marina]MBB4315598.1 nitrogen fixation protein NifX [Roseospira marina]MBB5088594.1 nitrogen fixation protein NifX [Roseospira marina]